MLLNPSFKHPNEHPPDITTVYQCSPNTKASGFTRLMTLVLSGRNPDTGRLNRYDEPVSLLSSPESTALCKQTNSASWTALMLAARNSKNDSSEEAVRMLLAHESGKDVARLPHTDGWTALMLAAQNSKTGSTDETIRILLEHESGQDVARMQSKEGWTALMLSARYSKAASSEETVRMLLQHESAKDAARMQDKDEWTALMHAAQNSKTDSTEETVRMLLEHESGKDVARMQHKAGWTALMLAAQNSETDSRRRNSSHVTRARNWEGRCSYANQRRMDSTDVCCSKFKKQQL